MLSAYWVLSWPVRGFYGASRWLKAGIEERPCLLWRERSLLFFVGIHFLHQLMRIIRTVTFSQVLRQVP